MIETSTRIEQIGATDQIVETADAHRGHELADFFGDEEEEIDHMFRLTTKALAQLRILRGNADRTRV